MFLFKESVHHTYKKDEDLLSSDSYSEGELMKKEKEGKKDGREEENKQSQEKLKNKEKR